jgi:hypothetical protein
MQIYVFGLDSPSSLSVIYAAAAAVHLCVSCMFISFMSEKLFMCIVTTHMICAISFSLSLHCNLQICGKSSLISTVSLTRPPSLSTSKSLSFRILAPKAISLWCLIDLFPVDFRILLLLKSRVCQSWPFSCQVVRPSLEYELVCCICCLCIYMVASVSLVSSFSFQLWNLFLQPSRWAHPLMGKRCTTMILGVNQFSGSNCCWITFCVLHLLRKCYIIEFAKLLLF